MTETLIKSLRDTKSEHQTHIEQLTAKIANIDKVLLDHGDVVLRDIGFAAAAIPATIFSSESPVVQEIMNFLEKHRGEFVKMKAIQSHLMKTLKGKNKPAPSFFNQGIYAQMKRLKDKGQIEHTNTKPGAAKEYRIV